MNESTPENNKCNYVDKACASTIYANTAHMSRFHFQAGMSGSRGQHFPLDSDTHLAEADTAWCVQVCVWPVRAATRTCQQIGKMAFK